MHDFLEQCQTLFHATGVLVIIFFKVPPKSKVDSHSHVDPQDLSILDSGFSKLSIVMSRV